MEAAGVEPKKIYIRLVHYAALTGANAIRNDKEIRTFVCNHGSGRRIDAQMSIGETCGRRAADVLFYSLPPDWHERHLAFCEAHGGLARAEMMVSAEIRKHGYEPASMVVTDDGPAREQ